MCKNLDDQKKSKEIIVMLFDDEKIFLRAKTKTMIFTPDGSPFPLGWYLKRRWRTC